MRWQTEHRSKLNIFEERNHIIRFHPLIDMTKKERDDYIREHRLPFHLLKAIHPSDAPIARCQVTIGKDAGWGVPRQNAAKPRAAETD